MNSNPKHITNRSASIKHCRQRGAVLVVALLLLLVMTVLGTSGVGNSLLEERMSGNFHETYSAMQAAETALRVAENWLTNNAIAGSVQFVPATDSSYDIAQDWFGAGGSAKTGLYSTQVAPGLYTPCQGKDADNCSFNATDKTHWCATKDNCNQPTDQLPRGSVKLGSNDLGTGTLPAIHGDLVSEQPHFIIEYLGRGLGPSPSIIMGESSTAADARMYAFRITAIGWGREETSLYVLQSHFQLQL
ncbi:PilX N-terminal domain-containing pilus assembly protein [Pseudomonadota bacterium]